MLRRGQHDDGVVHDGGGDDVDVFRRLAEEVQVVEVLRDAGEHLFLVGDAQGDVDARIQLDEFAQQARREVRAVVIAIRLSLPCLSPRRSSTDMV